MSVFRANTINFHRVYIFYAAFVVYIKLANKTLQLLHNNFRMTRNEFGEKVMHFGMYVDGAICWHSERKCAENYNK